MTWVYLVVAILGEVIGTTALKASNGFTVLVWSLVAVAGYAVAFYFLSVVLKTIPVGVAYAIWSGLGVAVVTVIGIVLFGQRLDAWAWVGIGLIVAGVMVLNLLSDTAGH